MYFKNDNSNAPLNVSNKLFEDPSIDDVRRVREADIKQLASNYETSNTINKLNRLIEDYADKEKHQETETNHMVLFNQYVMKSCSGQWCNRSHWPSLYCTSCLLTRNHISWSMNDDSLVYSFIPIHYFFTLADNLDKLASRFLYYSDQYLINTFGVTPDAQLINFKNLLLNNFSITDIKNFFNAKSPEELSNIENIFTLKKFPQNLHPFQLFQIHGNELESLFYLHRKWVAMDTSFPLNKNVIFYNIPIDIIHYNLAEKLLRLYHMPTIISKYNTSFEQVKEYDKTYLNILIQHFKIDEHNLTTTETLSLNLNDWYIKNYNKTDPFFLKSKKILFAISNGDTQIIDRLALLLSKIYLGRSYLSYLDKDASNLTVLYCNNINYINSFIKDILQFTLKPLNQFNISPLFHKTKPDSSYYHMTQYSMNYLCDEKNLSTLIIDKLFGNIVNIDSHESSANTINFKKLVSGSKISANGLSYRSNAHYIRIVDDINKIGYSTSDIPYDIIAFDGDLRDAIYEPLDEHELYFMLTGFLEYGIDLLTRSDTETAKTTIISNAELINEFIVNFCNDTTGTIKIAGNEIRDEKQKKTKVAELGIDQLEFTHTDTLYEEFNRWLASAHKSIQCCNDTEFKNLLTNKYHNLYYAKKRAILESGNTKDARGFYGLSVKRIELDQFIEDIKAQPDISLEERKKSFTAYLGNILSTYAQNTP